MIPGLFMASLVLIGFINVWLLLRPPQFFVILLELMVIPTSARFTLFFVVIINEARVDARKEKERKWPPGQKRGEQL